jgi:hypothetical protein
MLRPRVSRVFLAAHMVRGFSVAGRGIDAPDDFALHRSGTLMLRRKKSTTHAARANRPTLFERTDAVRTRVAKFSQRVCRTKLSFVAPALRRAVRRLELIRRKPCKMNTYNFEGLEVPWNEHLRKNEVGGTPHDFRKRILASIGDGDLLFLRRL